MRGIIDGIGKILVETLARTRNWINGLVESDQETDVTEHHQHHWRAVTAVEMLRQWEKMMLTFCLASAIAIATVSVQIETKLSLMFKFLSAALMACFAFIASAKLIKHQRVSQILYCFGGFWFVTSFFIAIAIPYAFHFRILTFTIYLFFLSITLICYRLS